MRRFLIAKNVKLWYNRDKSKMADVSYVPTPEAGPDREDHPSQGPVPVLPQVQPGSEYRH
jgi:hypothetical protein